MFRNLVCLVASLAGGSLASAEHSVTVEAEKLTLRTSTVEVRFDGPSITSVKGLAHDVEFIHPTPSTHGVDLFYLNGNTLGQDKGQSVEVRKLSDLAARIVVNGNDSHRSLFVTIDEATGDVCVTPSGSSARRGVQVVGWRVPIHPEAVTILPAVNGLQVRPDAPHPGAFRFAWPFKWEAQFAIAERGGASMMIHSHDRQMRFKALRLGRDGPRTEWCLESEPPGPLWENRTAGGVEWRINVYDGDWKAPAGRYRHWMAAAYDLAAKRKGRPAWVDGITLAVCWAPAKPEFLEKLAEVHPPDQTLIHLSHHWRDDKYDLNYPDYTPNEQGLAYMARARELGFHVMPHFNYWAVWEDHPFYGEVRDFQIRSVDQNRPEGWYWPPESHNYTRMAYIHPSLGLWRDRMIDTILEVCDQMQADAAFIDQTLCTWNTDNGLIEGMTTLGGMAFMQEQFAAARPGLVLVGEGLNEISFQRQCFAQAHIHEGWGDLEQKHVDAAHPICSFLWEGHTRLIGYHHLSPDNKDFDLGVAVYENMNALPTIVTSSAKHLEEMSPGTRLIFDRAKKGK